MSEQRVLLDAANFMDSPRVSRITAVPTQDIREIVQRFLHACYTDIGKAPRLLDGQELAAILCDVLPRYFGVRDRLLPATEEVLRAFLEHLDETEVVFGIFELRTALDCHIEAFRQAVLSGIAHADGIAITAKGKTIVHRAEKTGRNDPCPCGSGKKFKKCCGM